MRIARFFFSVDGKSAIPCLATYSPHYVYGGAVSLTVKLLSEIQGRDGSNSLEEFITETKTVQRHVVIVNIINTV